MVVNTIRLLEVHDQKLTSKEFSSFQKLAEYAGGKSGSVQEPTPKKVVKKNIVNNLQKKVESKKAP